MIEILIERTVRVHAPRTHNKVLTAPQYPIEVLPLMDLSHHPNLVRFSTSCYQVFFGSA